MFGSTIAFNYADGESTYRTATGSCISCSLSLVTLLFLLQSLETLYLYKGTSFTSATLEGNYDKNFTFSQDSGFQIAVGLQNYDYGNPHVSPKDYLDINAEIFGYDPDTEENIYEVLDPHDCTAEELYGDKSKFYPVK